MPTNRLPNLPHVTLENPWIIRSWCVADGLATTEYKIRPTGSGIWLEAMHWHPWWPCDGIVTVDGIDLPVSRTVNPPDFGMIRGQFLVKDVHQENSPRAQRVDFTLTPLPGLPGVELVLHAELLNDRPMLRTWLTVRNVSASPCEISRFALESIYPSRLEMEFMFTGFDVECFSGNDPRFLGRSTPRTTKLLRTLQPGQSLDSFSLLTAVCPADYRWHIVARHDLVHEFAPHTKNPKILQQANEWKNPDDLRQAVNEAADVGIDVVLLFTDGWTYGDFQLNKRFFPNGDADLKALCDYAATRGVQIGFYVGECIAPHGCDILKKHPDWEFLGVDGRRYDPGAIGNMCPSSGWGDHFRKNVDRLLDLGVKVLQTDGPPYNQVCYQKSHGHRSPETACVDNWIWEQQFNRDMLQRGIFVQSPTTESRLFDGAGQICGGYTEDDMSVLVGLDQITQFRSNLVAVNDKLPPSCRWGFMSVGTMYEGTRPSMVNDPENNLTQLDHALATHLGLGFTACLHGAHIFNGPKSKALVKKWIAFYNKYKPLLTARTLTLRAPSFTGLDAVLHCSPLNNPCGVIVAFNPTDHDLNATLTLPLEFAGWKSARRATIKPVDQATSHPLTLDDHGQAVIDLRLPAYKVECYEVTWF